MALSERDMKRLMQLRRQRLRLEAPEQLASFLVYTNPKYQLEWFHKVIADACQQLFEGKIKNLMIFVPPQHGKSEIVSRNFPAWALGRDPNVKIAGCSYAADLAEKFSLAIQRTIDSREYQSIFPDNHNVRRVFSAHCNNNDRLSRAATSLNAIGSGVFRWQISVHCDSTNQCTFTLIRHTKRKTRPDTTTTHPASSPRAASATTFICTMQ